jgi:ABC-2 type transport system permease protein
MSKSMAIWRHEFRNYWYSPIAYIVITVFLVIMSWLFFKSFFIQQNADMSGFFGILPWAFLFLLPAVTMRQWAEERKSGTIELLMTMPISEREAVIGKFLASLSLLVVILLLTLPLTLSVAAISQNGLDGGQVAASYLGALLIGAAYLAIGGWASSFTENQIVAWILGMAFIFVLVIIGEGIVTFFLPGGFLVLLFDYLGLNQHYVSLARGVIDTRDLVYYFSVIFLFLYLTVRALESRKWS